MVDLDCTDVQQLPREESAARQLTLVGHKQSIEIALVSRPQPSDKYEMVRRMRCGPLSLRSKGGNGATEGPASSAQVTETSPHGFLEPQLSAPRPAVWERTRADQREASSPTLSNLRRKMIRSISNRSDHPATPSTRTSFEVCALPTIHQPPVRPRRADEGSGQRGIPPEKG